MRQHDVWILELASLDSLREFLLARPELEFGELDARFEERGQWCQTIEGRMSIILWKWLTAWFESPIPEEGFADFIPEKAELNARIYSIACEIVEKFDILGLSVICMTNIQCLNGTDVAIGVLRQGQCSG
jgi:hypothetical protein